jgi:hypothetical protein
MIFTAKTRSILFAMFAFLLCIVVVYHLTGVFYKVDESPVWRHLLFAGINLFCVYGVLKRPKYFVYLAVLLLVQQYYSHGTYMIKLWVEKKQVHWISVFDLLLLPVGLICLIEDSIIKKKQLLF